MLLYSGNIDQFAELEKAYSVVAIELKEAKQKISVLEQENILLKEQLLYLQGKKFAASSEINLGEIVDLSGDAATKTISVIAHARKKATKRRGRNIDTSDLPRYKMYHDLDDAHKICMNCNVVLEKIGQDTSEQLEVLPMRLYIVEHTRYKYACRPCQTIVMSPKPSSPIPKSLAGGSLLAEVIINKYQYHLPLYRQSKIFESFDALIPDNTLGNWVMQSGEGLIPFIGEALWQSVLAIDYLQVDETPIKLLTPNKKGYLWSYFAPHLGQGLVVFELSETRSGSVAETRLSEFTGLLQTDGYAGYKSLRQREGVVGLACLTHCRRKFVDVLKITKNANGVAAEFVQRIKPLYALEEKMRELKLTFHTRKRLRQKQAWPILKALFNWLKQQQIKVPPKSKLGQAIQYTLNQKPYLNKYLRHGKAEIDTNWVENTIRPIAVGRRNWLFMKNVKSGAVSAFWYSLISSAILNGLNPRVYIHFLLMQMHELRQGKVDPVKLLPHIIDRQLLVEFSAKQIAIGKQIFNSS